jgi:hypothetical protein
VKSALNLSIKDTKKYTIHVDQSPNKYVERVEILDSPHHLVV